MKQVHKPQVTPPKPKKKPRLRKANGKYERKHPKFGTSKLEERFAKDFLDKLNVRYQYQFEAKDIGRYYDFYLQDSNLLIEVDGSYYHSDPRVVTEDKIKPMHKKNKRVDELKDRWALMHGIPIMRFWEKDINEDPDGVMKRLKDRLYIQDEDIKKKKEKNKRHINKLK